MLELKNIEKSYQKHTVLHAINLTFTNGIYALLGPNGAGKSTLMKIICGQLTADQGGVYWKGTDIRKDRLSFYRELGYAPQQQGLYDDFTGERFLTYMALLKDIPKAEIPLEVQRCAIAVNMIEHLKKKCKTYSGGMKQRLLVAQALLGNPRLLLFDEPTAGLDPKERVSLRHVFEHLASTHILLIATHVVSDIESIAKDIIFLKEGIVIKNISLEELTLQDLKNQTLEDLYLHLFEEEAPL